MAFKDVTSTSFGLVIAFLLPGVVALFSLSFWFDSAQRAFHTFLTANSNIGLFLFLLLGALALGLAVNAVRLGLYEILLGRIKKLYGPRFAPQQLRGLAEQDRFAPSGLRSTRPTATTSSTVARRSQHPRSSWAG